MSRWQPEQWVIAMDEREAIAVLNAGREVPQKLVAKHTGAWADGLGRVLDMAGSAGVRDWSIIVSGDLVQHWVCGAPEGVASLKELRQYAGLRRAQLFGDAAEDNWAIEGDWSSTQHFVCSAVSSKLLELVSEKARDAGARWRLTSSIRVLMASVKATSQPVNGWMLVQTPFREHFLLRGKQGGWEQLGTRWIGATPADVDAAWGGWPEIDALALASGLEVPETLQIVRCCEQGVRLSTFDRLQASERQLWHRPAATLVQESGSSWLSVLAAFANG